MERVKTLVPKDSTEGNAFLNLRTKIQNKALGNDTAWKEAQPLFTQYIEGYPEKYRPYSSIIRTVFDLRRDAFLQRMTNEKASAGVKKIVGVLEEEEQDLITPLVVSLRDFFDTPVFAKHKQIR